MKIGFSTIACPTTRDLESLQRFEPQMIEVCGCSNADWAHVRRVLSEAGITIGLHCATPHDGWPPHFEITGPDESRRRHAFGLLEHTLRAATEARAAYVVVHFPSVIRDLAPDRPDAAAGRRAALAAAQEIAELSRRFGMPVLLENVGPNPYFRSAGDFAWLFAQIPSLRMCLDFAHAHVVDVGSDVYSFSSRLARYVSSMHVYNASPTSYRVGRHGAPYVDADPAHGWMDLERLLRSVLSVTDPQYLVFEYSFDAGMDQRRLERSIERIRQVACEFQSARCSTASAIV